MACKAQKNWGFRVRIRCLAILLVGVAIVTMVYNANDIIKQISEVERERAPSAVERERTLAHQQNAYLNSVVERERTLAHHQNAYLNQCDIFSGKWVFDNVSYPLYRGRDCRYMYNQQALACDKYGRKDLKYQQWRWQPHGCDLPRFKAKTLLKRLRNKRLMFVGDSINRSQWVSLICMIQSSIPRKRTAKYHGNNSPLSIFKALDYNATIEFYWAPFLVESNCDDPRNHRINDRAVRVQAIEKHGRHWLSADILIFDSYLWWRLPKMKVIWGSFESVNSRYEVMTMPRAFKMALNTWSNWLRGHVNTSKTQLFFIGMSPTHERAERWGGVAGGSCYGEVEPIKREGYKGGDGLLDQRMKRIVGKVIGKLKSKGTTVHMLNITHLSEYRKDAHVSIHKEQTKPLSKRQLARPSTYADCSHWCLPGLLDVWNELLYTYILYSFN